MQDVMESVLIELWNGIAGPGEFPDFRIYRELNEESDGSCSGGITGRERSTTGHISAEQLEEFAAALRSVLQLDVRPADLSGLDSFKDLAAYLGELRASGRSAPDRDGVAGRAAPATSAGSVVPASRGQAGLWFIDQSAANPAIYNSPIVLRPGFDVDPELLERALRYAVARHESLRTTFETADGELMQRISERPRVDFSVERCDDEERYQDIHRCVMGAPFDLAGGPLVRAAHVTGPGGTVRVLCNVHHIVFDATSVGLLLDEWFSTYVRLRDGGTVPPEGRAEYQYRDFVRRQRERLDETSMEDMLGYWQEKLAGPLPLLDLPLDKPRPLMRTHEGGVRRFTVPAALAEGLRRRAAEEGLTPYMMLLSGYALLLNRYTRQSDVLIGSPATLRDTRALRQIIGYLVNTVVTRHRFEDAMPLRDFHQSVKSDVIASLQHKHVPLDRIIQRVQPERSSSHPPVFQTMFVMPDVDTAFFDRLGLPMEAQVSGSDNAKYDLTLFVEDRAGDGSLSCAFEYDSSVLEPATVDALGRHYEAVLRQFVDTPDVLLGRMHLLDEEEERVELARRTVPREPVTRPVMDLFREQAARTPDATAVVHEGDALTYRQLDEQANRFARLLRSRGIGAGQRVGVHLRRAPHMVVGLLGILKSGAAYVPIDPSYPEDRIAYALRDSGARLVVTESALAGRMPDGIELFLLDREGAALAAEGSRDPGQVKTPDDEFYVIYTSGSTGKPKGVVLNDATIANLIEYQKDITAVGTGDRTLQYMSLSFDVSIQEVLGTLCAGGTLVLITEELQKDLHRLAEFMVRERIARAYFPYIALQQLTAVAVMSGLRMDALREVVSTGEQLVVSPQVREFFGAHPQARLWNMYGPSESHVVSAHRLSQDTASWPEAAPIGLPLPGFSMPVMDGAGNLVPPGVAGELYLGGPLISPGYNRLPQETARRFLPYGETAAGLRAGTGQEPRLYRTGDLVRVGADGVYEYLGRVDNQVKVRGYRVEPSEIESALNGLEFVKASAVVAISLGEGDKRLVAFLEAGAEVAASTLRERLGAVLPDYMVPAHFVHLDAMPTTPSGKIDRKALPGLFTPTDHQGSLPPRTPVEREIAVRWSELLKVDSVGVHDDFFHLGGHSILATQLVYRLRDAFGIDVGLRELLRMPTVAGMAGVVEALLDGTGASAPGTGPGLDLWADVRLPESVAPTGAGRHEPDSATRTRAAGDVLLTGATGFLGSYLLRDLLEQTDARVHCLVRAGNATEAHKRLEETARRYRLADSLDTERVVPVPGDLSATLFGLDETVYTRLVDSVGVVYHAAAHINFVAPYATVKTANVDGMTRVLEFCTAAGRPVPLHYASTIAVFSPEHRGVISEDSLPEEDRGLGIGYTQSKWVAERLAFAARERGVPVSVYRMGRISGDSVTGACQADDFFWRQIKSFVQLGSAPPGGTMTTDLLPADFVSNAMVRLSRQEESAATYHLFHPRPVGFDVVYEAVREAGYALDIVPADVWLRRLETAAEDTGDNALAAAVPLFQEGALELGENVCTNESTTRALHRLGLDYPEINTLAVTRMIQFFRQSGEVA
ncbi:amino acid adenylation domain-containing protein [Streptomyces anulatus]